MLSKYTKKYNINTQTIFFLLVSILIVLIMMTTRNFGDDIDGMYLPASSFETYIKEMILFYQGWSSRIIVNFFVLFFTGHNKILWAISIGISSYVFMYALNKLFVKTKDFTSTLLVILTVLMFPFYISFQCGWIATLSTYFSPMAFGFLSLVPIKKTINNENFKIYEYIIYSLSLLYGANNEQMMVVIFCSYLVAMVYLKVKKIKSKYCFVQLLLALMSLFLILKCPGNATRLEAEITVYPTWISMNIIDKLEIGITTTIQFLLNRNIIALVFCSFLVIFNWKKYGKTIFKLINLFPIVFIIFGFMNKILKIEPIAFLYNGVSVYGLITPLTALSIKTFIICLVWSIIIIIIIINVILLCDNIENLIISLILLGTGFVSRVATGLSPFTFSSTFRISAVLIMSILIVLLILIIQEKQKKHIKKERCLNIVLIILIVIKLSELLYLSYIL